jgi:hypothetical protein
MATSGAASRRLRGDTVLYTIIIIVLVIALIAFLFNRSRGRGGL